MSNNVYWHNFYNGKNNGSSLTLLPSQFAAFVAGEVSDRNALVLDLACGNGRDANFFSQFGFKSIGIDNSISAIEVCKNLHRKDNLSFYHMNLVDESTILYLKELCTKWSGGIVVYSRFFLHSITDIEQDIFFGILANFLPVGASVYFEFRTSSDASLEKAFSSEHFRRYASLQSTCNILQRFGFHIEYSVEGQGLAKYKSEDAIVGRIIGNKL
jgi:tellurite methyltransferase